MEQSTAIYISDSLLKFRGIFLETEAIQNLLIDCFLYLMQKLLIVHFHILQSIMRLRVGKEAVVAAVLVALARELRLLATLPKPPHIL